MLTGPMISGEKLVNCKTILSEIKDEFISKHDKNIYIFNLTTQGNLGYGADWHPSILQSQKNADELTLYLCKLMNWHISTINKEAKLMKAN